MKKAKKIIKVIFVILIIVTSITIIASVSYYQAVTHGINLDQNQIEKNKTTESFSIYDSKFNEIKPTSSNYISLSKLSKNTKNAFICAEDKRFYTHKGLDFKRIGGAILSNIKTKSFSQGASTISQQLVKNTQLSNEKTINRKLKELKLTKQLENNYSKDEILELYLNNIYFGAGCYGIENASKHYFGKTASKLSLAESAILASTINAPAIYDIENNFEKTNERKNLILNLMKNNNKISNEEYSQAINEKIATNINTLSSNSYLYKSILEEACSILKINESKLNFSKYKIYTNIDSELIKAISKINQKIYQDKNVANIVIDNRSHKIIAESGQTKLLEKNWQPGSTIKPILVYAPAIENDIISPATKLLDEKININGYTPENADKKFHGYISAKQALSKSYNIPAVKLLNEVGIDSAKNFATKLKIDFEDNDNHLALALGGFSKGVKPKTLVDAYSALALNGNFQKSNYIQKITKDGKTIFESKNNETLVMKDSTAFLITDMLIESTKTGTAKRMSDLKFELASKTGTVGKANSTKNLVAYNIAYTKKHTILTIITGDNLAENVNGSTYPTMINKEILSNLYKDKKPENFDEPSSVSKIKIDEHLYNENKILETTSNSKIEEYFSNTNIPEKQQECFKLKAINLPNQKPILCFTLNENCDFSLIRTQKKEEKILFSSSKNDQKTITFIDKTAKTNEIYEYKLKICVKSKNEELYSNSVKLRAF